MRAPGAVLAAVCLGWGTIPLLADATALPSPAIAFGRVAVAATGLALALAATRPTGPPLFRHQPLRCVVTGAVLAAHWTAMFAAYGRAPDDTVIFVIFLAPVAIAAVERPSRRLAAALVPAVAGLALIAGPGVTGDVDRVGLAMAVAAAGLFVALVLLAKPLASAYGALRLTFMETAVAAALLAPFAVTSDVGSPRAGWLLVVVLGLVHTAMGTGVYLWALARLPATEVGILGYLEPLGVVLCAWAFTAESPAVTTLAGGVLVVVAGALAIRSTPPMEVPVRVPAR